MEHKNSRSEAYAAAGVDITAGYRAVELMKKLHNWKCKNWYCTNRRDIETNRIVKMHYKKVSVQ